MAPLSVVHALLSVLLYVCFITTTIHACTTLIGGRNVLIEQTPFTTHNNDCTDCDVRLAVVHGGIQNENELEEIEKCRFGFPRRLQHGDQAALTYTKTWTELEGIRVPKKYQPIGHVHIGELKSRQYSYIDGTYGIANEAGLAMGESTCSAKLVAYSKPRGDALFDIAALSRIALKYCDTVRCAVKLMGEMAEKYGYYGADDPPETGAALYEESGEALTLIDTKEAWVFHILPDDTGKSAVWAAQRVQDNHIAVVANRFIIQTINRSDSDNFLASENVVDVAVRAGFWPEEERDKFNFASAYAPDGDSPPGWGDRRTWRIFHWAAPSQGHRANQLQPYPFSVPVDQKLSIQDIFSMNRDHFEGTEFDLSVGPAAGPFGNPNRYDPAHSPEFAGGYFERAISLHRTSYSFVAQSRSWVVPEAAGLLWFAQHAPHSSLNVPIYTATKALDESYERGTLFSLSRESSWWAYAAVANYAEKSFKHIQIDVIAEQQYHEALAMRLVEKLDKQLESFHRKEVIQAITDFTVTAGQHATKRWWSFFDFLLTKYRDGQRIEAFQPPVQTLALFYPAWWLGRVGYYDFGPMPTTGIIMPDPPGPPHASNSTSLISESASSVSKQKQDSTFAAWLTLSENMKFSKNYHVSEDETGTNIELEAKRLAVDAYTHTNDERLYWQRFESEANIATRSLLAAVPFDNNETKLSEKISEATLPHAGTKSTYFFMFIVAASVASSIAAFVAGQHFERRRHYFDFKFDRE